jgi:hypothetical protein
MVATSCPRVVDPNCKHRALSLCSLSPCLQFSMAEQPSRASPLPLHHRCCCCFAAAAPASPLLLLRRYRCYSAAARHRCRVVRPPRPVMGQVEWPRECASRPWHSTAPPPCCRWAAGRPEFATSQRSLALYTKYEEKDVRIKFKEREGS